MGIFSKLKRELRAEETDGTVKYGDLLLSALLGRSAVTKETALAIPSVNACITYIAGTISQLPIKLYKYDDSSVEEIQDDPRLRLLNDETGDTLDAAQFWTAMVRDYFLGKGGYAYINTSGNAIKSLHYVPEDQIAIQKNTDPIFKDYDIYINGQRYYPMRFLKILRNTKDGMTGASVLNEISLQLCAAYSSLVLEKNSASKGGNKRGFIRSQKKLTQDAIDKLREAWGKLYSNDEENIAILNDGLEFKEASNSAVELQMNENKKTNAVEFCKVFGIPENVLSGNATETERVAAFKQAVMPVIRNIECALNRDFLLEEEKDKKYWAVDIKEVTKGDIKARYEAYALGITNNFLLIDEARYMEDLPPLGIKWIKLGLDSVLYDPQTKQIYTPNTDKTNEFTLKGGVNENESGNKS